MKKYLCFIADALSLMEIIMGLTLVVMIFLKTTADITVWVFVTGEICDAFDGICARRWPYPPNTTYWWRRPQVVQAIEHSSDILLISALAFYLLTQGTVVRYLTLFAGIAIAVFCIWIEICLRCLRFQPPLTTEQCRKLIRRRRYVYLLGIAIGIAELIFCTSWPSQIKLALLEAGVVIGVVLIILKWDRFTETHENFLQFLRHHWAKRHDHL